MMAQNVLADFVQVFGDVGNEFVRCRVLALNLFEDFDRRFVWINFLGGLGERVLFGF